MASSDAMNLSFDSGFGSISNAFNVDNSVPGQVTLAGGSAMMEWAVGAASGHGYGTYDIHAMVTGNQPGPAIVLWPGDNKWPGQEIDMVEITPNGSGQQYGTVHWNAGGSDGYNPVIYDGVKSGVFHDYTMVWEPGKITFLVDGQQKGVITDHVPVDYAHGGMNNTIGFLNNNPNTSITVDHVSYTPLGDSVPAYTPLVSAAAAVPAAVETAAAATTQSATDLMASSGPIDWNAVASLVQANYQHDGYWHL
jgi:beta-glucanase (GH16 family)